MFKNIIFDLGNVLIEWNADTVYDQYFANTQQKEEFYLITQIKELNIEFDKGLPFAIGLEQLAQKFPQYKDPIWMWRNRWQEMLGNEIVGTLQILSELKAKGYNLYALTNWAHDTFLYAEDNFNWLNHFIDIVVSGRENLVKPDPAIYQLLLKRNNLNPCDCVFIDDSVANITTANSLGIKALHFKNPEQLRSDLQLLKLL